jgi:phospholipid/cholesterol/gamma-HCH transport system permease protein
MHEGIREAQVVRRLESVGAETRRRAGVLTHLLAVAWSVLCVSVHARAWPRTVRNVLARQILFTGYEAVTFVATVAVMVGLSVVLQTQLWLNRLGQSALLGPVLVMVVVREVGPLLANFIVIGRSGTAIATELGNMNVNGEVRVLDAQGLDPFTYLIIPRVLGVAISVFCLTVVFVVVSFISGYLSGLLLGAGSGRPGVFFDSVIGAIRPSDVLNLLAKTWIPGLLTGTICCVEGLSISTAVTEVPQAATRAVVRSITALFVSSALVSLLTYL